MAKLKKTNIQSYGDYTRWIIVSDDENVQSFPSHEEAIASAKEQYTENPDHVLCLYKLENFISARVQPPMLFDPIPEEDAPPPARKARKARK